MIFLRHIADSGHPNDAVFEVWNEDKLLGSAVVFHTHEPSNTKIDFCCIQTDDIPEMTNAIIQYAKQEQKQILKFPQFKCFSDGTYCNDIYLWNFENKTDDSDSDTDSDKIILDDYTISQESLYDDKASNAYFGNDTCYEQILLNYKDKMRIPDNWGMGYKIWKYVKQNFEGTLDFVMRESSQIADERFQNKDIAPVLFLYKTNSIPKSQLKHFRIDLFKDITHEEKIASSSGYGLVSGVKSKKEEVCRFVFEKTIVFQLKPSTYKYDDVYAQIFIDGIRVQMTNPSDFRINKWQLYSDRNDIIYSDIMTGYKTKHDHNQYILINSVTLPKSEMYTKHAFKDLLTFVSSNKVYRYSGYTPKLKQTVSINGSDNVSQARGYIYLIREREFVSSGQNVYKHGKTIQKEPSLHLDRLKSYKKGSELQMIKMVPIPLLNQIESTITQEFKSKFKQHSDGNEYFIGDPRRMMDEIEHIIRSAIS